VKQELLTFGEHSMAFSVVRVAQFVSGFSFFPSFIKDAILSLYMTKQN
jgi:hypothetical protein